MGTGLERAGFPRAAPIDRLRERLGVSKNLSPGGYFGLARSQKSR